MTISITSGERRGLGIRVSCGLLVLRRACACTIPYVSMTYVWIMCSFPLCSIQALLAVQKHLQAELRAFKRKQQVVLHD